MVRSVALSWNRMMLSIGQTKMIIMGVLRRLSCKAKKGGLIAKEVGSMIS
jgi:hypothetical protein